MLMMVLANLLGLGFLMLVAYRGYSVILFAPVAAMIPVLLTHPADIPAIFTGLYMEKAVYFVKLYFPLFLLGAIFGKLIELGGFARAIVAALISLLGKERTILATVLVAALLTYGGVSLLVVVFAVYPFAAEMFKQAEIPKRLLPPTLALGMLSFTMDALPGTPQIQNIIPTTFFNTSAWAAPKLGLLGSAFILGTGLLFLHWRVRQAGGEGYGESHIQEPFIARGGDVMHPLLAMLPLVTVPLFNWVFGLLIPRTFGRVATISLPGLGSPLVVNVAPASGLWALEGALLVAILLVTVIAFRRLRSCFSEGSHLAVSGALLATMNTASEYGFGAVIAALPGFVAVRDTMGMISNPLINAAVTTTVLAGITGSASLVA
jgi:H+/gluconate symporter-like permease